ncbi:interleukin-6 receptor subunit beta [Heterodontus francisci]|uniref:interleukin-6 receptor subunit beta n=1 Tax=Heterodontus francisci TaxID=7792 RepID=UPI00355C4117
MKRVVILLYLLASLRTNFSQGSKNCDSEPLPESTDGPHNLECYYVGEIENGFNCSWTPGTHHTNATLYTLNISWGSRKPSSSKLFHNIASTFYTIQRKKLYISDNATIWVETMDPRSRMCHKTKSITLIPQESERPETPSNIAYRRMSGQLHLIWHVSKKLLYELRYRKAGTVDWLSANFTQSGTLQELEQLSAYEFRVRCKYISKISLWSLWSSIYYVPPELIDMPQIRTPVTKLMQNPGKRIITIQWENPATAINATVHEYNITIERLLANQSNIIQSFKTVNRKCIFILSQAPFKFRVLAYNSAGSSPANEMVISPLNLMSLRNKINATSLGNDSILISWKSKTNNKLKKYIVDWGPIIGNETHVERSEKIKKGLQNYILKGTFEPKQRYRIMLHRKTKQEQHVNNTEITIGIVDVYTLEGTPRTGPNNIIITNISKTSAMIRWDQIPEDECQGFLQGYRIFCYLNEASIASTFISISVNSSITCYMLTGLLQKTVYAVQISGFTKAGEGTRSQAVSFATKEFGEGELQNIAVAVSVAIIGFVFLVAWSCSFLIRRIKKMFWPSIPNPGNSHAIQIIGRGSSLPHMDDVLLNLNSNSRLMETEEEPESLHTVEEVTSANTDYGLQENEQNNITDQESKNDLREKPTVIQVTDYTTMENFRQIMPTIANCNTVIQPNRSESECNDQYQQSDSLILSYMKQQVHPTGIETAEDNLLGAVATEGPELLKSLDHVKVPQGLHSQ